MACEFVKYKFKPSELSALLGMWGPWRQYEALLGLIRAVVPCEPSSTPKFMDDYGLSAHWAKLGTDALRCEVQEHIAHLADLASQSLLSAVGAAADTDLDNEQPDPVLAKCRELRNSLISRAQKSYGRNNERRFVNNFNKCAGLGKQIHSQQQEVFRYLTEEPIKCAIVGKIDGYMGTELVEIKHRRHLLFDELPAYEMLQVHAYMFAAGKGSCKVIQCVRRQDMEATDVIHVNFSEEFWAKTMERVQRVINFAEQLTASPLALDAFKSCSMEHKQRLMCTYI